MKNLSWIFYRQNNQIVAMEGKIQWKINIGLVPYYFYQ